MGKNTLVVLFLLCCCNIVLCHELSPDNLGIIGGHVVPINKVPYMASLRYKGIHYCGASILNERFLLSAAHCKEYESVKYKIVVGTDQISNGGDICDVEKIIPHAKYNNKTKDYDICLIKLANNITFGPNVNKIALADKNVKLKTGIMLQATGWGSTDVDANNESNDLLQVDVPLKSKFKCTSIFIKYGYIITPRMICAGAKGKDACQGDSGGPLTLGDKQVGVTSFGNGCGKEPGIYTKISTLLPWIQETIKLNS